MVCIFGVDCLYFSLIGTHWERGRVAGSGYTLTSENIFIIDGIINLEDILAAVIAADDRNAVPGDRCPLWISIKAPEGRGRERRRL